ncbi:hypothetical protein HNQ35_000039 [Cerasibacillus quisquiliarum]|uniref:Uncharacterized protein n=1 Tax=Cerasibacillus quisquiliarum TaxID=227865 RepID=A0A511UUJ0_9BACI|nr:hypothetical protein [Cerasibacillus quisquiliarum]MBB5144850.1 hypothetical protein [Cerasibacillus quisquiliarum]GEN30257.1 hypothetical protein CQU01_04950 [Cerasibacillus quisquiliarum]
MDNAQMNLFGDNLVIDDNTKLKDLLKHTNHIDIELLSDTREKALSRIKKFEKYGEIREVDHVDKWFQINSENQKINVFSYYEKGV